MMKPIFFFAAIFTLTFNARGQAINAKDSLAIMEVFQMQEAAWNAGNIDQFMEGYWKSDRLVFVGSAGPTYGWEQTRSNYKKRYPDLTAMGQLSFEIIRMDQPARGVAFVVGKFYLKREIDDLSGYFTLVWRKIKGKWLIISDHTS